MCSCYWKKVLLVIKYNVHMSENQGWEFAQQFSERIARFLRKNE